MILKNIVQIIILTLFYKLNNMRLDHIAYRVKAHAVSLKRDKGFKDYDWREVGLTKMKF